MNSTPKLKLSLLFSQNSDNTEDIFSMTTRFHIQFCPRIALNVSL